MEVSAKGRSGQMTFDRQFVTITRDGFVAKLMHGFGSGTKSIPIRNVGAVQYKPATSMTLGYIQLSFTGEQAKKFRGGSISGVASNSDIAKDENSILFAKKVSKDFEQLAVAIRAAIGTPAATAALPVELDLQQIEKLAALLEAGHVTQAEFDAKKADVLNRL